MLVGMPRRSDPKSSVYGTPTVASSEVGGWADSNTANSGTQANKCRSLGTWRDILHLYQYVWDEVNTPGGPCLLESYCPHSLSMTNRLAVLGFLLPFTALAQTVRFQTNLGDIDVTLLTDSAPATVANF